MSIGDLRLLIIAELQQGITQDLKRVSFAWFQFDQSYGVIARGHKLMRREFRLSQQVQPAGIVLRRQRCQRGARRLHGNLQRCKVAGLANALQVPCGEFVLRDKVVGVLFDSVLKKPQGLLIGGSS